MPGLDLTALRALRGRQIDQGAVLDRIAAYRDRHNGMWVAWLPQR
ncbi:hypothetical protein QSJ19_26270 [Gordonia sp. ABSL11-1]|nr:hypothetical protein [Gordonia sp. ABSL11-1]MDL9949019.1 hypothetical protein [Gordonia sp. ABSL11-1]